MASASEAQKRASKKWNDEKIDALLLRLPKGTKQKVADYAHKNNESVNSLICKLIEKELSKK